MINIFKTSLSCSIILILYSPPLRSAGPDSAAQNDVQKELILLKQQISALTAQVNRLQKREAEITYKEKTTNTDQTPIQVVKNGSDKTKLTISGWVNRAVVYYDNGRRSELKHVDASEYSSRLKIAGESLLNAQAKVGATFEMEAVSNSSYATDIGRTSNSSSQVSFNKRIIEVFLKHQNYGDLYLGHGPMASDSVGDCDLSNTNLVTEAGDLAAMAGGVRFIRSHVPSTALAPFPPSTAAENLSPDKDRTLNSVWQDIMGALRVDRIRYDTPHFKGFTVAVAHGTRDISDIGLRYAEDWHQTKVIAGLGFVNTPFTYSSLTPFRTVRKGSRQYGGSVSVLFPNGISIGGTTAAKKYGDPGRKTGTMWSAKAGYQRHFFNWGLTSLAVVYGQSRALFDSTSSDNASYTSATFQEDNSEKVDIYGFYIVQNIDKISTDVFGGIQTHQLKRTPYGQTTAIQAAGYGFKRILAAMLGARVRF